ncbi:Uncharacterised protein [uncultured archaeon]|nr:Uncharacterised protein [uncultured archaeon]
MEENPRGTDLKNLEDTGRKNLRDPEVSHRDLEENPRGTDLKSQEDTGRKNLRDPEVSHRDLEKGQGEASKKKSPGDSGNNQGK